MQIGQIESGREVSVVVSDLVVDLLGVVHQVHLVDRDDDVADAQERHNEGMAPRLREHSIPRVDEDHGEIAGGRARRHVASVLLVAGSVRDDKFTPRRREIAIRDIDRDPLLPLGAEAISQQGGVEVVARRSMLERIAAEGGELVFVDHLAVVEQASDERTLAVVDTAARKETQEFLLFVLLEVGVDIGGDQVRLVGHGCVLGKWELDGKLPSWYRADNR